MIFLTGDTHIPLDISKLNTKNFSEQKNLTRDDYVIILGDFGLYWHEDKTYEHWHKWLQNKPFTILWVDGNHENHDWIDSMPISTWHGGKVHRDGNIIHLMRGQVFDINDKKFFVMGGADSYDRFLRIPYVNWWPEECPNHTDIKNAEDMLNLVNFKVDYVLTHTCPTEVLATIKNRHPEYIFNDKENYVESLLQNIKDHLTFKEWFFGHWHENFTYENYRCLYDDIICLNDL